MSNCLLTQALCAIRVSQFNPECERDLLKHAISVFIERGRPSVELEREEPCSNLVRFYAALKYSTGLDIQRPTAAVALLTVLELQDGFKQRFGRLTSRRKAAAHPDPDIVTDLKAAISCIPGQLLQQKVKEFTANSKTKRSSSSPCSTDSGPDSPDTSIGVGTAAAAATEEIVTHEGATVAVKLEGTIEVETRAACLKRLYETPSQQEGESTVSYCIRLKELGQAGADLAAKVITYDQFVAINARLRQ